MSAHQATFLPLKVNTVASRAMHTPWYHRRVR